MYEQYWDLLSPPFSESHSQNTYVNYNSLSLARIKLKHIVGRDSGGAALVGPPGVGKTALARHLVHELIQENWACSYIVNPLLGVNEVLSKISADLGGSGNNVQESLINALLALDSTGRRAIIVVDDAHTIVRTELLENLRMLMNFEIEGRSPLAVFLLGQDNLPAMLKTVSAFDQRLALIVRLKPMSEGESKHYILSRLKNSGCNRGIFTRTAAEKICELAAGIPREINRICELSLVVGFGFGVKKIKLDIVNMVAQELGLLKEEQKTHVREAEVVKPFQAGYGYAAPRSSAFIPRRRETAGKNLSPVLERPATPGSGLLDLTLGKEDKQLAELESSDVLAAISAQTGGGNSSADDVLANLDQEMSAGPDINNQDILAGL